MLTVIEIFIIVATLCFIGLPFFRKEGDDFSLDSHRDENKANLINKKEYAMLSLRDLEDDFLAGKVSGDDYNELKTKYETEAIIILKKLDGRAAGVKKIDITEGDSRPLNKGTAEESEKSGATEKGVFCRKCGTALSINDKFCFNCGVKI